MNPQRSATPSGGNKPSIGIANSVSANFDFDPMDTIEFAKQENFDVIQIFLNDQLLDREDLHPKLRKRLNKFEKVYYHAEGFFNKEFPQKEYYRKLTRFLQKMNSPNYILHFDEKIDIDNLFKLTDKLSAEGFRILVENYFQRSSRASSEKNIKKYTALFTLVNNVDNILFPVLDIPRLFHKKLGFRKAEALEWCYQLLNFFGNKNIPIVLHLVDCKDATQSRASFCALGEGYIPYPEIFAFIKKTNAPISDIILEFEDKINPVVSRKFIEQHLRGDR